MPQRTTDDTRERILDAADRLLGRLGFQKTTLDDLAREAGIGRRTIYLHFDGKHDVALASIDRVVDRLCAKLGLIALRPDPASARLAAMLEERVLHRVDAVRDYSRGLDELFAELRPAYLARRQRYFDAEAVLFERVIAEGAQSGELDSTDPNGSARALLLATNALLPYSLSPAEMDSRAKIRRDVRALAEHLLMGLVARESSPSSTTRPSKTR
jgi:AcrR family transcriptional regulator